MSSYRLPFEEPVWEIEQSIEKLRNAAADGQANNAREIKKLEREKVELLTKIFSRLTPWQKVQVARHPARPSTVEYVKMILDDVQEIHGDRRFGDDRAMFCGVGTLDGMKLVFAGQRKGRITSEKIKCNFGMAHPEGYRKALRVMRLAEKYNLPMLTLIDTPGAYPGIGAEERGQAFAIAENIMEMSMLRAPIVGVVLGEGGSGGALGIGITDKLLMMEYAYYSVISPEGCAAILWRSGDKVEAAAAALKLNARELIKMGLVDGYIEEPPGGAHRSPDLAAQNLKQKLVDSFTELRERSIDDLVEKRGQKYRQIGVFKETGAVVDLAKRRVGGR